MQTNVVLSHQEDMEEKTLQLEEDENEIGKNWQNQTAIYFLWKSRSS